MIRRRHDEHAQQVGFARLAKAEAEGKGLFRQ